MPVEFIGLIRTKPASELNSLPGSLVVWQVNFAG